VQANWDGKMYWCDSQNTEERQLNYDVAFPDDNSIAKIHKRDLTVMEE
jgi:hypothetical protein